MQPNANAKLIVNDIPLSVHLGWGESERANKQIIMLTITLTFLALPTACESDELADTICYAVLIERLQAHVQQKQFKLIEHLAADLFQLLKQYIHLPHVLRLALTKHPVIPDYQGAVTFSYGEA